MNTNIIEEALITLNTLHDPGEIFEIRVKRTDGRWSSGLYSNTGLAYKDLCAFGGWDAAYVTLNPIEPEKILSINNGIRNLQIGGSTTDSDILRRKWLFVEIDTTDASDNGKMNVKLIALMIHKFCKYELKMPDPEIVADSCVGVHMIWRNLHEVTTDEYKTLLKNLSDRFNSQTIKIDQSIFNLSCIVKIYGTSATKNYVTRMSKLVATGF